jgi:hydrogenase nickel incorporation protein HypA/HybF
MHEMSLAQNVVKIAEETAARAGHGRVTAVWVEIGALSAVEPEALRFCFDAAARDSLADGARLEIVPVAGAGWCLPCGRTVAIGALYDACPECGRHQVQPTAGTDMRVKEIEVE